MKKFITIGMLVALLACASTQADEANFTNFGNWELAETLEWYINLDDKEAADLEMDRFIDGWIDGMQSMYAYDNILGDVEAFEQLMDCTMQRTPGQLRKELMAAGSRGALTEWTVSKWLYYKMRFSCAHVLGEVQTKEDTKS